MAATTLGNRTGRASIITTNETNQITTQSAILHTLIVNNVGSSATIDIYDHASTNTNKVFEWVSADGKVVRNLELPIQNGLRVISGGTLGNVVVIWE